MIATPPQRRLPIRTFILPFDPAVVREALLRERRRGGRSFVVVPGSPTWRQCASAWPASSPILISSLRTGGCAPTSSTGDARISPRASTTCCSPLPSSRPGSTSPVQTRCWFGGPSGSASPSCTSCAGASGAGRERAACYLLHDQGQELPEPVDPPAALAGNLREPGCGFAISARDLDLRGAGDAGRRNAGRPRPAYRRRPLPSSARARPAPGAWRDCTRGVVAGAGAGVPASIPGDYVPEAKIRLELYARLARAGDADELDGLAEEIGDRFGTPPPSVSQPDAPRRPAAALPGTGRGTPGDRAEGSRRQPCAANSLPIRPSLHAGAAAG